jgi:hypothetical protein
MVILATEPPFLAFFDPGVPRKQPGCLELGPQFRVELQQGAGNAHFHGARLRRHSAAGDICHDVECAFHLHKREGLPRGDALRISDKVMIK